jgi:hypothetical protein
MSLIGKLRKFKKCDIFNLIWKGKRNFAEQRHFLTEKQEKLICFAGEYFYAKKGIKTTQFWGAVHAEMHPWDNSFAGYKLSYDRGIRYSTSRGNVQAIGAPISVFYKRPETRPHLSGEHDRDHVIMVTNRLAWGDVRKADCVIGTGTVCSCSIILRDY